MPQADNNSDRGLIMEVMESIRSKLDDTRDKVIEQSTRQKEDRKLHDERHTENQKWRDEHKLQHQTIIGELEDVKDSIKTAINKNNKTPQGVDKNLLMKLAFGVFFLLVALIFGLTGVSLPTIPGVIE